MYWKSYDFGGQAANQNLYETPLGPDVDGLFSQAFELFEHDGGEVIFSLPNGMHGYYLATADGKRLQVGPSNIVHDASRTDRVIVNGLSCISCHSSGIQHRLDNVKDRVVGRGGAKFSRQLRRELEDYHIPNEELANIFASDEKAFLQALEKIGAAKRLEGILTPILNSEGIEPIRYLSDWYEEGLDATQVASEFGLSYNAFASEAVGNEAARYVQASACDKFPRESFERDFGRIVSFVTDSDSLSSHSNNLLADATVAASPNEPVTEPIRLKIDLPDGPLKVGDRFTFTVASNKDCRFRIFTLDSEGKAELHDPTVVPEFLGDPILKRDEVRRIPVRGQARVDPPAGDLKVGIVCSLSELSELGITDYELRSGEIQGRTKGITFKMDRLSSRFREDQLSTKINAVEIVE